MNCILHVNKTGCQWRMPPKDFPPHNIVFYNFRRIALDYEFSNPKCP